MNEYARYAVFGNKVLNQWVNSMVKSNKVDVRSIGSKLTAWATAVAAIALVSGPAAAEEETSLFLAGYSGSSDDTGYGYVGGVFGLGTTLDRSGFLLRLWADGVFFDYESAGKTFDGDGYGFEAELGYQQFFGNSRITGYVGPNYRHIDIDPEDPDNDSEGDDVGAKLQGEASLAFTDDAGVDAIAAYSVGLDEYFFRLRPYFRLNSGLSVGPEAVALGGDKYDIEQYGVYLSGIKLGAASLGIKGGVDIDRDGDAEPYYGVSLAYFF